MAPHCRSLLKRVVRSGALSSDGCVVRNSDLLAGEHRALGSLVEQRVMTKSAMDEDHSQISFTHIGFTLLQACTRICQGCEVFTVRAEVDPTEWSTFELIAQLRKD
eukprot:6014241-Alexandrium_andersonii.AAC.1